MTRPSASSETDEALPIGTVDLTAEHFVLLHGDQNTDSATWTAVAWLAGTDPAPIVQLAPDLPLELRGLVEREVASRLRVDPESSTFVGTFIDATGAVRWSWQGSLRYRVGTTGNWYGDLHWAYRRGR
jgi:hypothetical protein